MEKARNDELYRALKEKDYPDDFCREIAYNQIRTDYTATRMLGYLYRTSNPRAEDVVDEMLAIFSDRDAAKDCAEREDETGKKVVKILFALILVSQILLGIDAISDVIERRK